jgi:hypothetical protein
VPDPAYIALAASLAGITAAVVLALAGLPWQAPHPKRLAIGALLGVGLGFSVGCGVLKVKPDWPAVEDQDRFLGLILPAVLIVEIVAAAGAPSWLAWILRFVIACAVPRVLLHGTVYLDQPSADGGMAWTPAMRWTLLPGLAAALFAAWALLVRSNRQHSTRVIPLALGLTCCGAGLTVMLSGYASGGQLGPILGGALIGAVVGSLILVAGVHFEGAIGFSVVGLFGLLMIGRFFGELTSTHAVLLFLAPLLSLFPLSNLLHRWPNLALATAKIALVLLPLGIVVGLAGQQFVRNSQPVTESSEESTTDYSDYGS